MKASDQCIDLLIAFEGIELQAYRCPAGIWTIGIGHTGTVDGCPVSEGMSISHGKAMQLLREDLRRFEEYLCGQPFAASLKQHQFDALISFLFNVGTSAFHTSTMRRKLLSRAGSDAIASEFGRWVYAKADGKTNKLPGLVHRREQEAALFLNKQ